jgi:hypothetical protein
MIYPFLNFIYYFIYFILFILFSFILPYLLFIHCTFTIYLFYLSPPPPPPTNHTPRNTIFCISGLQLSTTSSSGIPSISQPQHPTATTATHSSPPARTPHPRTASHPPRRPGHPRATPPVSASWRAIQVELYLHVNTILAVGHTLE